MIESRGRRDGDSHVFKPAFLFGKGRRLEFFLRAARLSLLLAWMGFRDIVRHPAWLLTALSGFLLIAAGPILDLPGLAFPSGDRLGQAGAIFLLETGLDAAQLLLAAEAAVGGGVVSRRLEQGALAQQMLAPIPVVLFALSQCLAIMAGALLAGMAGLAGAGAAAWLASPDPIQLFAALPVGPADGFRAMLFFSLFLSPLMLALGFASSPGGVAKSAVLIFLLDLSLNLAILPDSVLHRFFRLAVPDFGLFSLSGALHVRTGAADPTACLLGGLGGGLLWFGFSLMALERFGRDRA